MYYINADQIRERLASIQTLSPACLEIVNRWNASDPIMPLAQERALQLAIETVTDVGSLLIDAFLMRDPGSYEDLVGILAEEGAFSSELAAFLVELVKLRRPLVQEYYRMDRSRLHPFVAQLPDKLAEFASSAEAFISRELGS